MKITIKVLDVKDGDAIIVMLEKKTGKLIMLIDGGKSEYHKKVVKELTPLLSAAKKKAPDVILCTHYDSDHIGGLIPLVKHYGKETGQVWMFKSLAVKAAQVRKTGVHNDPLLGNFDEVAMKDNYSISLKDGDLNYYNILITSLKQQKELETIIKSLKIKLIEPFEGKCRITGWPEVKVIAPSLNYYKKLFPKGFSEDLINNEITALKGSQKQTLKHKKTKGFFETLDNGPKEISAVNMASAILMITVKNKKFLFTGDAGVASFENITNYKRLLKDIYWLKVPHHASARNINSSLISLMKPAYAVISGKKYINKVVIESLKLVTKNISSTSITKNTITFTQVIK